MGDRPDRAPQHSERESDSLGAKRRHSGPHKDGGHGEGGESEPTVLTGTAIRLREP